MGCLLCGVRRCVFPLLRLVRSFGDGIMLAIGRRFADAPGGCGRRIGRIFGAKRPVFLQAIARCLPGRFAGDAPVDRLVAARQGPGEKGP